MTAFDSFSTQLLEEAKALLEKARHAEDFTRETYLHSSLLLAISALEASINAIVDEILIEPYNERYTVHEQALLREKDVRFDKGEFTLNNGLKITRITDRLEFLFYKFSSRKIDGTYLWYSNLKQSIDLRNKLVHPKEDMALTITQVESAVASVVETINELYLAVYKRKYPAYDRGVVAKELLES